jgi:hypothetical protein
VIPEQGRGCGDGIDNDFDGAVDCDDSGCATDPNCTVPGAVELNCANGADDADPAVDLSTGIPTFVDADGYRLVVERDSWAPAGPAGAGKPST